MTRSIRWAIAGGSLAVSTLQGQASGPWSLSVDLLQSVSPSRPNRVFGAQTTGVGESALSLRASTPLLGLGPVRLWYTAQVLPVVRLTGVERWRPLTTSVSTIAVITGEGAAYGVGLVPLGLDLDARLGQRTRLGVGGGVGIAAFTQRVPVAGSRRRQFSAEWGARLGVDLDARRTLEVGFRWKHTSNGFTAWENPGLDSRLATLGLAWRMGGRR